MRFKTIWNGHLSFLNVFPRMTDMHIWCFRTIFAHSILGVQKDVMGITWSNTVFGRLLNMTIQLYLQMLRRRIPQAVLKTRISELSLCPGLSTE